MSHERNEHVDRAWSLGAGTMSRPQRGLFAGLVVVAVVAVAGVAGAVPAADHGSLNTPLEEVGDVSNVSISRWGGGVENFSSTADSNDLLRNISLDNYALEDQPERLADDLTVVGVLNVTDAELEAVASPHLMAAEGTHTDGTGLVKYFDIEANDGGVIDGELNLVPSSGDCSDNFDQAPFAMEDGLFHFAVRLENASSQGWNVEVFRNGTSVGTNTLSPDPCVNLNQYANDDFVLGCGNFEDANNCGAGDHFPGKVFDLRVFQRALSDTEIESLADANGQLELGDEAALYTFGDNITGSVDLPISPDAEFDINGNPEGIAVTHHETTSARVFVRTWPSGTLEHGGKILRFDHGLGLDRQITACDGPGLRNMSTVDGLTTSWDNLVVGACKKANDEEMVAAVYSDDKQLDTLTFETPGDTTAPRVLEANTLNRLVFTDSGHEDFYEGDVPAESVLRKPFGDNQNGASIHIDGDPENNVSWVVGDNGHGLFVASSIGGVTLLENTTHNQAQAQIFNRTVWTTEQGSPDQVLKLEVRNASELEEIRRADQTTTITNSLGISKDGGYLLVKEGSQTNGIHLYDAQNLSKLATLGTTDNPEKFAMDRCNNFAYVIEGDASDGVIRRYPVHPHTDTSAGGNGTTGLNPCPSNPFTQNTKGTIGEGQTAVAEEPDGFASQLKAKAATQFGMTENNAGFFLGGLFLLGFALIGAQGVSRVGGQAKWGAGIGLGAGLAFTLAMDLIPLWFVLVMALVAAAVVVFRR